MSTKLKIGPFIYLFSRLLQTLHVLPKAFIHMRYYEYSSVQKMQNKAMIRQGFVCVIKQFVLLVPIGLQCQILPQSDQRLQDFEVLGCEQPFIYRQDRLSFMAILHLTLIKLFYFILFYFINYSNLWANLGYRPGFRQQIHHVHSLTTVYL